MRGRLAPGGGNEGESFPRNPLIALNTWFIYSYPTFRILHRERAIMSVVANWTGGPLQLLLWEPCQSGDDQVTIGIGGVGRPTCIDFIA